MARTNIILTGFMGTGKSTVGRILARRLGYIFVDTDEMIQERTGLTVPQIFERQGEAAFRAMEAAVACELAGEEGRVIATGGRLMLDPANAAALLRQGRAFCLTASEEEILRRVTGDGGAQRPLLADPDPARRIAALLRQRAPEYARFTRIDTSGRTPEEVADILMDRFSLVSFT